MVASKIWRVKPKNKYNRKKRLPLSRNQVKAVRKIALQSQELKYIDSSALQGSTNIFSGTANIVSNFFDGIDQGDDNGNREGDSIQVKSFKLRFHAKMDGTERALLRVLCIQTRGQTAPSTLTGTSTAPSPLEFLPKMDSEDEPYRVLYDKVLALNEDGSSGKYFTVDLAKKKGFIRKIQYENNATTTVNSGKVYVMLIASTNISTGEGLSCNYHYRINYRG